jgi:rhodanese-related sulfurtransferase
MTGMWRTLQRSLLIAAASAAFGLAFNAVSPRGIPYIPPPKPPVDPSEFIPLTEAFQTWSRGAAVFLDARAPADYQVGHIANAFNLPAEAFHEHWPQVAPYLTTESSIVCYCDGMECDLSHHLADQLREAGYTNVHVLQNGWTAWSQAGYPTSTGTQP